MVRYARRYYFNHTFMLAWRHQTALSALAARPRAAVVRMLQLARAGRSRSSVHSHTKDDVVVSFPKASSCATAYRQCMLRGECGCEHMVRTQARRSCSQGLTLCRVRASRPLRRRAGSCTYSCSAPRNAYTSMATGTQPKPRYGGAGKRRMKEDSSVTSTMEAVLHSLSSQPAHWQEPRACRQQRQQSVRSTIRLINRGSSDS